MTQQKRDEEGSSPQAKKPYEPPALVMLGKLRDVTTAVGYRSKSDGGRFPRAFRTSL